ncbi:neurofilament heavy polypeptide-like [Manacus vitellinus]|uniref:neurofilament heavy polypeptide-like n=1 Tax=Manacus vitellinus TaxID=328815 RepID=UPI00115C49EB|nr:neurofilament heavy polypeptide-like [Manacus vitellinus]
MGEGATASDEGATAREEVVVVTEEGAIGREEAGTREEETVTREGARPRELGARPKEYRTASREKKATVQTAGGILSLDDLYPDYTFSVTKDAKKEPKHPPQLEGELSLPLQTQPSLGGVNDWRKRPLSHHVKDYSLPPPAGYHERRRSPSPQREWHRSPSPRRERRRSPSPWRERRRSPSPRHERRRSPSLRRERRRSPSPRYERHRKPSPRREQYRSLSPRHAQSPPPHERYREEVGAVPRRSGRVKREVEKILRGRDGQEIMRESEITQSLTTRELRDLRRDYMRLPGEEVLTWLVRCWDKGADSHVIEGDEARQLGSIARDPVIEQEMGREKMASSLWLRILHAVRVKYPFKESLKSSSRRWRTAEEGIQYLRELAMLEIIYSDPDYYDIQVPENVPCTQPMWKKVIQGAPKPYVSCLIPVYNPKMEEPSVDTMCAWIRTIEENMEDSFNPLYRRTYDRERTERDYEYSRYEDDLRDREDRRYRDYQERPMGRSRRDRQRRPRPRPRSWSRSCSRSLSFTRRRKENSKRGSRNQLWAYLRSKGENMKKWDGEPTSKLEARVRELKRKKTDKKVVYVVDGDFLEEKLRSPKHEKMEVHFDNGKKSKKSKSNSDDECSDQDQ